MAASDLYQPQELPQIAEGQTQLTPDLRQSYIDYVNHGLTLGPQDFHNAYHSAGHAEIPDLKDHLLDNQTLTDHSIEAVKASSLPLSPDLVAQARDNISDYWVRNGKLPDLANGPIADAMTREPPRSPVPLQGMVRQLEASGDDAVSPKGAIGRYQIMPGTAKQYGYDPERLKDPLYNTMVNHVILDDLTKRYHGETAAILIAYNAGPGRADAWIKSGRDTSTLPDETQKYLAHASKLDDLMRPARDAIYDPMGTLGSEKETPVTPGFDLGKLSEAAGIPSLEKQFADIEEHKKKMKEEGASEAEMRTYGELNNPFLNAFGVGTIGDVVGLGLSRMFRTLPEQAEYALSQESKWNARASIRQATGEGRRFIAAATEALEQFRAVVNKDVPDFKAWLDTGPGQTAPLWSGAPDIMKMIDYIENSTAVMAGQSGTRLAPGSPLFPVANALRGIYEKTRLLIEQEQPAMSNFIEDYYRHLWTRPTDADRIYGAGQQGNSASLKERIIPTIADGIAQGLRPRILDPIENTLHYVSGMTNYLMSNRVLQQGKAAGYVKYSLPGSQPAGWVPLQGRSATIGHPGIPGATLRAYAPSGYAQSYNAFVGRGFYDWPVVGQTFQKLQQVSNLLTGLKLSLSGFHAINIAHETIASTIANGIGEIGRGELARGMKDIGYGVTVLPSLASKYMTGKWLQKAYLNPGMSGDPLAEQLASIYAKVGGRAVGRGAEYGYTQAVNWGKAWQRGSLATELKYGAQQTLGDPAEPIAKRFALGAPRMVSFFGHELGRAMGTITAPLFDNVIPKLKSGAWADEMSTWLRQNPTASHDAILKQGRLYADAMDDRFGELVQDNLFWPRALKQSFNLATVSVGWEFGTIRAAERGARELMNGNVLGPYARWLLSYPIAIGISGLAYQYLKTGIAGPSVDTPGLDTITPRTGGATVGGQPERALLPGVQKDALQWFHLIQSAPDYTHLPKQLETYAVGKMNPLLQTVTGIVTNHDWAGNPVFSNIQEPERYGLPSHWKQLGDAVLEAFTPIGTELGEQMKPGTNVGKAERYTGVRPAPEWLQDPQRTEAIRRVMEKKEIQQDRRRQARQKAP